jgi:hypothetical protein
MVSLRPMQEALEKANLSGQTQGGILRFVGVINQEGETPIERVLSMKSSRTESALLTLRREP